MAAGAPATKMTEKEAVLSIKRVIQRIRLATPENMDALETELLKSLEEQAEVLGAQHAKLKDESEKAIAVGKKRAAQISEKRAKEEEQTKELRDIIKEMSEIIESLDCSVQQLREAASLEGDMAISADDVPAVESMVQDCDNDVKKFDKAVHEVLAGKGKAMMAPTVPADLKKEWAALGERAKKVKSDGQALMLNTRKAMQTVKAEAKKNQFAELKPKLIENIKVQSDKLAQIDEAIQTAEDLVAPFAKAKHASPEEMLKIGDVAEPAVDKARDALARAQGSMEPPPIEGIEDLKDLVDKFYREEGKKIKARLGQLSLRVKRAANLVSNYRLEAEKIKNNERLEELKPKIAEKIKEASEAGWPEIPVFDTLVKAVEAAVELFRAATKSTPDEMKELADTASQTIEQATEGQTKARESLIPLDDEDGIEEAAYFRTRLKSAFAAELRDPEEKLGKIGVRLDRAKAQLKTFKESITKKIAVRVEELKGEAKRALRAYKVKHDLSAEELFAKIDKDSTGAIDESSFLAFMESEEAQAEGEADSEQPPVKITSEDLKMVFAACLPKDEVSISPAAFAPMATLYMKVAKATTLTTEFKVAAGKVLRQLKVGEALEILDGPVQDGKVGVKRFKGRALSDESVGWATMAGNAGTVILKECTAEEAEAAAAAATP